MPQIPLLHAILGGLTIGLGLAALLLFNGQLGGVGGAYSSLVRRDLGAHRWKLLYVLGIVAGGGLVALAFPAHFDMSRYDRPVGLVVVSGLIMGFGGRLCNGCTSGHGLCGISRFSPRSMLATGIFFGLALLATYVLRHTLAVL